MSRGLMKQQAKDARAKKDAKTVTPIDGKAARANQMKYTCSVCKQELSDIHVYKVHFDAKHPKLPVPAELSAA